MSSFTSAPLLQARLFATSLSEDEAIAQFKAMRAEYQAFFLRQEALVREQNQKSIQDVAACLRTRLQLAKDKLHFLDMYPNCQGDRAAIMRECLLPMRREVRLYPDFHGFQRMIKRNGYPSAMNEDYDFDWMEHMLQLEAAVEADEAKALAA
jgi:hypothetical protein